MVLTVTSGEIKISCRSGHGYLVLGRDKLSPAWLQALMGECPFGVHVRVVEEAEPEVVSAA